DGVARREAVEQAVRLRLRPILMSTLTSLFGMLPLLLIPGPGTELYRGLAAVIVGGLSVSTVFTLVLLPSLLRFGELSLAVRASPQAVSPG
ncbi:MAG: efflux RND transporter permease subunit, partial [Gammaproteobacteria bacterium]|nr:efflux RND transporter permease subunit [Gammaproteobacteria bacterium]